jgi:two-component system NtrC family sensor kinase
MGLSISFGILQKHGGSITANSKEGEGTEFVMELPIRGLPEKTTQKEQTANA